MRRRPASRLRFTRLEDRLTPSGFDVLVPFTPLTTAAQPDGKVVVVGTVPGDYTGVEGARQTDIGLTRVTADGATDPTFNGGRVLRVRVRPTDQTFPVQAVVGPDGKVTVLAITGPTPNMPTVGASELAAVLRVNPDGTPDAAFGCDGCLVFSLDDLPTSNEQLPTALAVGPDGSTVIVGRQSSVESDFVVVRLTPAGAFDLSFDGDGRARVAIPVNGGRSAQASEVAVLPDGRIVVGGTATESAVGRYDASFRYSAYPSQLAVVRLTPGGAPDASFDGDGVALVGFTPAADTTSGLSDLAVTADGRVVLVGTGGPVTPVGVYSGYALRLTAEGALDPTFDGDGVADLPAAAGWFDARPTAAALRPDGSLVVAGSEQRLMADQSDYRRFVTALLPDGRPDPSFARLTLTPTAPLYSVAPTAVAVRPDGSVAVVLPSYGTSDGAGAVSADGQTYQPFSLPADAGPPVGCGADVPEPLPREPVYVGPPVRIQPVDLPTVVLPQPITPPVAPVAGDLNADRVADRIVTDGPRVSVVSGKDGSVLLPAFAPFEAGYTGTLNAVLADVDGDGRAELVVSPDQGGGPVVAAYRADGTQAGRFWGIEDAAFRGGVRLAGGDVNGDGASDLVVTAGAGGGPRAAVFDGRTVGATARRLVGDFYAFEAGQRGGAFAAVADGQLVFGAGPGGGPRVRAVAARDLLANAPKTLDDLPAAARGYDRFVADPAGRKGARVRADAQPDGTYTVTADTGDGNPVPVFGSGRLVPAAAAPADPFNGAFVG